MERLNVSPLHAKTVQKHANEHYSNNSNNSKENTNTFKKFKKYEDDVGNDVNDDDDVEFISCIEQSESSVLRRGVVTRVSRRGRKRARTSTCRRCGQYHRPLVCSLG